MLNKATTPSKVKSVPSSSNENMEQLGLIASSIAHDFNNMLTNIMGHMSLALLKTANDDDSRRHIERAVKTAEYASALTSQLLEYSRKQPRKNQYIEYIDLNKVIDDVVGLVETVLLTGLVIKLKLSNLLPQIKASETHMQQIVMNLLINAAEAIDDPENGEIMVSTGRCYTSSWGKPCEFVDFQNMPPGNYVFFQVSDNGRGMQPEMLSKIFDPFYTTKPTGTGLGLSTILNIVEEYQGYIKVKSNSGKGTTFRIYFPCGFDDFSAIH